MVKNLPAVQETQETKVQSLGWKDPLEEGLLSLSRFSLLHMEECVCAKLFQSRLTLCDPVDHGSLSFSVHGLLQARILEWVACPPRGDLPHLGIKPMSYVSCIGRQFLYH